MGRKTMALLFAPRSARARQNYVRVFYGQNSDDKGREREIFVFCAALVVRDDGDYAREISGMDAICGRGESVTGIRARAVAFCRF